MSVRYGGSLMRHVNIRLVAMFVAIPLAMFSAMAQSQSFDEFSSSSQTMLIADAQPFVLPAAPAPALGGGQAYPSYGSHGLVSHLTFEAGGGFNAPIGNDIPYITWGGNFTVGGGLRFDPHVSLLAEYQFIDDKLPGGLIADAGAQGGHAHIWSFTLDPVIDFFPKRKNDVYVTGGGGFYRKVTSFTDSVPVTFCDFFCYPGYENVVVSHFSSNQGGANFGLGITHQLGGLITGGGGNLKAFAEVRYLWLNTPAIGTPNGLGTTELLPVTLGIRW